MPCEATPSAKARDSSGEEGRMSCPMTTASACSGSATTCANAEPRAKATSTLSWSGTTPLTS